MFIVLVIIGSSLVEAKSVNVNNCYNSTRDFYPYLASRTPYQFIHGDIQRPEGCTPLQIWMTARHGTRYPDTISKQQMIQLEDIRDQIVFNHEEGRGQLCPRDLTNLRTWRRDPNFYEDKNGTLGSEGKKEFHLLAKRLKDVFPEILGSINPSNYNFMATNQERATSSLMSFANALFDTNKTIEYEGETNMKESRNCDRWLKEYSHDEQMVENTKFKEGPEMQQALREISQRLGFSKPIEFDKVNLMYDVCRYETALDPSIISKWCTVFTKQDLVVFEYLSDLDYYYCCGPGNILSRKLSCGILQKLFETFEQLETGDSAKQPNGVFNFGHSTNIQSLMSLLRVFENEEPLLASNFKSHENRLYNTTFMNAFSSNIVAVFYRCNDIVIPNQVMFHIAENPVKIPGCDGHRCDWEYLKREFRSVLEECDPNFCDLPKTDTSINASSTFGDGCVYHLISMIFVILYITKTFE